MAPVPGKLSHDDQVDPVSVGNKPPTGGTLAFHHTSGDLATSPLKGNDALRSRARRIFDGVRCPRDRCTTRTAGHPRFRVRCRTTRNFGPARRGRIGAFAAPAQSSVPTRHPRTFSGSGHLLRKVIRGELARLLDQDLTISLRSRAEMPGFCPWSVKDGVPHVQPPVELLEQMLTVRPLLAPCLGPFDQPGTPLPRAAHRVRGVHAAGRTPLARSSLTPNR